MLNRYNPVGIEKKIASAPTMFSTLFFGEGSGGETRFRAGTGAAPSPAFALPSRSHPPSLCRAMAGGLIALITLIRDCSDLGHKTANYKTG